MLDDLKDSLLQKYISKLFHVSLMESKSRSISSSEKKKEVCLISKMLMFCRVRFTIFLLKIRLCKNELFPIFQTFK